MEGFILIDKPATWTSHDIVAKLRGITKIKKIGHAGTLDPFATGLLIVGIGRPATKHLDDIHAWQKTYETTIELGKTSTTYDSDGEITESEQILEPTKEELTAKLENMIGEQEQIPPMFSAKKIQGKKLYELAREGKEVERNPSIITIHNISLLSFNFPLLILSITCSTGTYIRSIAHDLGQTLGIGGYCKTLRRTAIGRYAADQAISIEDLTKEQVEARIIPVEHFFEVK